MHGGLGFDHTCFRPHFDRIGDVCRVVYYDHRSNGRSGRPPIETFTMEQAADDAAALLDELGVDQAVVCGHSSGASSRRSSPCGTRIGCEAWCSWTPRPDSSAPWTTRPPIRARHRRPEFLEALSSFPGHDEEYAAMGPSVLPFYLHRLTCGRRRTEPRRHDVQRRGAGAGHAGAERLELGRTASTRSTRRACCWRVGTTSRPRGSSPHGSPVASRTRSWSSSSRAGTSRGWRRPSGSSTCSTGVDGRLPVGVTDRVGRRLSLASVPV